MNQARFAFAFVVSSSVAAQSCAAATIPSRSDVDKLESVVRLRNIGPNPSGDPLELTRYARYYTAEVKKHEKVIIGEWIFPLEPHSKPGVYLVASKDNFPLVFDGGCTVIHLVYAVRLHKLFSMVCNLEG